MSTAKNIPANINFSALKDKLEELGLQFRNNKTVQTGNALRDFANDVVKQLAEGYDASMKTNERVELMQSAKAALDIVKREAPAMFEASAPLDNVAYNKVQATLKLTKAMGRRPEDEKEVLEMIGELRFQGDHNILKPIKNRVISNQYKEDHGKKKWVFNQTGGKYIAEDHPAMIELKELYREVQANNYYQILMDPNEKEQRKELIIKKINENIQHYKKEQVAALMNLSYFSSKPEESKE